MGHAVLRGCSSLTLLPLSNRSTFCPLKSIHFSYSRHFSHTYILLHGGMHSPLSCLTSHTVQKNKMLSLNSFCNRLFVSPPPPLLRGPPPTCHIPTGVLMLDLIMNHLLLVWVMFVNNRRRVPSLCPPSHCPWHSALPLTDFAGRNSSWLSQRIYDTGTLKYCGFVLFCLSCLESYAGCFLTINPQSATHSFKLEERWEPVWKGGFPGLMLSSSGEARGRVLRTLTAGFPVRAWRDSVPKWQTCGCSSRDRCLRSPTLGCVFKLYLSLQLCLVSLVSSCLVSWWTSTID